jgi:hypothetical protein
LTSNVIEEHWRQRAARPADLAIRPAAATRPPYTSSMCSNDEPTGLAARLGSAIDDLAAAAEHAREAADRDSADRDSGDREGAGRDSGDFDMAARVAAAWALVTEADPELAERAARYAR